MAYNDTLMSDPSGAVMGAALGTLSGWKDPGTVVMAVATAGAGMSGLGPAADEAEAASLPTVSGASADGGLTDAEWEVRAKVSTWAFRARNPPSIHFLVTEDVGLLDLAAEEEGPLQRPAMGAINRFYNGGQGGVDLKVAISSSSKLMNYFNKLNVANPQACCGSNFAITPRDIEVNTALTKEGCGVTYKSERYTSTGPSLASLAVPENAASKFTDWVQDARDKLRNWARMRSRWLSGRSTRQ
jgi:hypothetical protein